MNGVSDAGFVLLPVPIQHVYLCGKNPRRPKKIEGKPYNVELNIPQRKGTISKCLMSSDRLREGKLPYCVSACPNGVYYFGDENEDSVTNGTTKETVRLSELIESEWRVSSDG